MPSRLVGGVTYADEREKGLFIRAEIAVDTKDGSEAYNLVTRGMLQGMSIGYITVDAASNRSGNHILSAVKLLEVSLTPFPANPNAVITGTGR